MKTKLETSGRVYKDRLLVFLIPRSLCLKGAAVDGIGYILTLIVFYNGRIPSGKTVVGDITCYNATGCNDAAVAYGYAGAYDDAATKPAVVADDYVMACFYGFAPLCVVNGVVGCIYLAIRPYLAMASYGDTSTIEHGGAIVDKGIATDGYHVAVVAVEWGCNVGSRGYAWYECF